MKKLISIITPCFNEEQNVRLIFGEIKQIFESQDDYDFEHLFIDNASTDSTVDVLRQMAQEDKRIKVIVNARNFGPIRSPFYAIRHVQGDAMVMIVADLQEPPELIREFIRKWEEGYKMVLGIKAQSREFPLIYMARKLYYNAVNQFSDITLIKNFNGFGLYDRQVVDILKSIHSPYPYFRGLVSEIGFEKAFVPFSQPPRKYGISKMRFLALYDWMMLGVTSHTKVPLRLATMAGFLLSAVSLLIGCVYLVLKLLFWNYFPMGMAPLVIGVFFFGSVQLFFIGLLGEYIISINTIVKNYPLVVEKERINLETATNQPVEIAEISA